MAKAAFVDTPIHQRLRRGLLFALEENDWRVADLARATGLAHNTISDFLNAEQGIGLHSLQKCIDAFALSPKEFFDRCDQNWQAQRLKSKTHGPISSTGTPALPSRSQAALDQLKAAFDVAAALLSGEVQAPEPDQPDAIHRPRRPRKPSRS